MIKRDHTKLICSIGEISDLFQDSTSLETFLKKIVEMISDHMHSEVCSIYLYNEDHQELILKATKGLNAHLIGKVKLKLGEGLTGVALKELRPICERHASKNPNFKFFPDLGEEKFESFLVLPISRGHKRIGAVVIQNSKRNYFDEEDIQAFRAITSQLAHTIETAKLLMSMHEQKQAAGEPRVEPELKLIKGEVASAGFAFAEAVVIAPLNDLVKKESDSFRDPDPRTSNNNLTLDDFLRAVQKTEKQLENFQQQIEQKLSDVASLIFSAQLLMLKDQEFIREIGDLIKNGVPPPQAVQQIVETYVKKFDQMTDAYLRERKQDIQDIGRRVLENLVGFSDDVEDLSGRIVIAQELYPSDLLKLWTRHIQGLILLSGGVTSHLAILARSLEIPVIIVRARQLLRLPRHTQVLMDAEQGSVYVSPSQEVIEKFQERNETRATARFLKHQVSDITKTKDGVLIKLLANINLLSDLKTAVDYKAQGVGLYRTEFPFLIRSNFPSEEEQYFIYKKLVEGMPGKEVTYRTLDIGGDKVLSYFQFEKEENPFLGMRSIRFSLRHRDIFAQQIRAILRCGSQAQIKIMFPMISSLDEFIEAKQVVQQCFSDLKKEGMKFKKIPPIGLMIELPSVMHIIDELASEADFLCIGTNDFIQYMLAVDRTNEKVADLYLPYHPAILRSLKKIVETGERFSKEVSVCGDMAQEVKYLPYLLGLGLRTLSLDSRYIPRIQKAIQGLNLKDAEKSVQTLLSKSSIKDIHLFLEKEKSVSG